MKEKFSKKVEQYTKNWELLKLWGSTRDVERESGFCHECIAACARGSRQSAYGYKWKYVS